MRLEELEEIAVVMRLGMLFWATAEVAGRTAPASPAKTVAKESSREKDVPRIDKSCVTNRLGQSGKGKTKHIGNAGIPPDL
jgi:hypothetical protein